MQFTLTRDATRSAAERLATTLKFDHGLNLGHKSALELFADALGFRDAQTLQSLLKQEETNGRPRRGATPAPGEQAFAGTPCVWIHIDGGLVQEVWSDRPIRYTVVDTDREGAEALSLDDIDSLVYPGEYIAGTPEDAKAGRLYLRKELADWLNEDDVEDFDPEQDIDLPDPENPQFPLPTLWVEISGGNVQNWFADHPAQLVIVDWDNIDDSPPTIENLDEELAPIYFDGTPEKAKASLAAIHTEIAELAERRLERKQSLYPARTIVSESTPIAQTEPETIIEIRVADYDEKLTELDVVSPDGEEIQGTFDTLYAAAVGTFYRDAEGKIIYSYVDESEVFWDSQKTQTDERGVPLFLDRAGKEWPADQLVFKGPNEEGNNG